MEVEPNAQVPEIPIGPDAHERIEPAAPGLSLGRQQPAERGQIQLCAAASISVAGQDRNPLIRSFWSPVIQVRWLDFRRRAAALAGRLDGQHVAGQS